MAVGRSAIGFATDQQDECTNCQRQLSNSRQEQFGNHRTVSTLAPAQSFAGRAPSRAGLRYAQLKLKLMLIRSSSTRLAATSWRSQLSNRITLPASAGYVMCI